VGRSLRPGPSRLAEVTPRWAVLQFALTGALAMVLVAAIGVAVIRHIGRQEAVHDAKQLTRLEGHGIVAPYLTREVLEGEPAALRRLDRVVRSRVLPAGVVRVKIWTARGRIAYSDEPRAIGTRYPLGAEERAALRSGGVEAEVSDLSRPENRFERGSRKLLEVYLPVEGPAGERVLFEAYQPLGSVWASGRRLLVAFAPAIVGALLLLQLINLPLARALARRLRSHQHEREELLLRSLDASLVERRRIVADLHDGVVQELAGVSYTLAAEAQRLDGSADGAAKGALALGAAQTRDSIRALRTLLFDIYPPDLHRAGLVAALRDLSQTHDARGLPTRLDAPEAVDADEATEGLLFRCAQEALRNIAQHADASHVRISLACDDAHLRLVVADDGRGFDAAASARDGHFGLPVLTDLVHDAGGTLRLTYSPGAGTAFEVRVPAR
jgi:signal transduction histidine kinase